MGNKMPDIEIRELKKSEYKIWDELVESSPQGTIFHSSSWLSTYSELLNKKLKIYGCFQDEQLVGGCSLFIRKLGPFKKALSTIRMIPYGGVILGDLQGKSVRKREHFQRTIINVLCDKFNNNGFDYIHLCNSPSFTDIRPFLWNGWEVGGVKYTYYLSLSNIESNISRDVRVNIKKAVKNNIIIEKSDDISSFYELLLMTLLRQNEQIPVSKNFFENIIELLYEKEMGELWIARTPSDEVAAAEIVVFDNKRAYRWSAASHTELRKTGAAMLLQYTIAQKLKNKFNEIDLVGANTPNIAEFKAAFNPKLIPYYIVEKTSIPYTLYKQGHKMVEKIKKW